MDVELTDMFDSSDASKLMGDDAETGNRNLQM